MGLRATAATAAAATTTAAAPSSPSSSATTACHAARAHSIALHRRGTAATAAALSSLVLAKVYFFVRLRALTAALPSGGTPRAAIGPSKYVARAAPLRLHVQCARWHCAAVPAAPPHGAPWCAGQPTAPTAARRSTSTPRRSRSRKHK